MDYEIGTRLDLILANQRALEAQIKELAKKVNALLLRELGGKPIKGKVTEKKEEVPVPETGNPQETETEEIQEAPSAGPELSKHAPKGGKWQVAE